MPTHDYADCTPDIVRNYIELNLIGGWFKEDGLESLIAEIEKYLKVLNKLEKSGGFENESARPTISSWQSKIQGYMSGVSQELKAFKRISGDDRMADVYSSLRKELDSDTRLIAFIEAAVLSFQDYPLWRQEVACASKLTSESSEASRKLAKLLRKVDNCNAYSLDLGTGDIGQLIQEVGVEGQNHYSRLLCDISNNWNICGLLQPPQEGFTTGGDNELERLRKDLEHLHRKSLRRPSLLDLLDELANAAEQRHPDIRDRIKSALASRQTSNSDTATYLRSFGQSLVEAHSFLLTPPILNAMATVATVVLGHPDFVVTYDDAKKAVETLNRN